MSPYQKPNLTAAFKKAMLRGLGRCIIELEENENIEKYRNFVLWG